MTSVACPPETFIEAARSSFIGAEQVYTQGSCVAFFRILKLLYPQAVAYWSDVTKHMIAEIDGKYYDIRGEMSLEDVAVGKYELEKDRYFSMSLAIAIPKKTAKHSFVTPYKPNP